MNASGSLKENTLAESGEARPTRLCGSSYATHVDHIEDKSFIQLIDTRAGELLIDFRGSGGDGRDGTEWNRCRSMEDEANDFSSHSQRLISPFLFFFHALQSHPQSFSSEKRLVKR